LLAKSYPEFGMFEPGSLQNVGIEQRIGPEHDEIAADAFRQPFGFVEDTRDPITGGFQVCHSCGGQYRDPWVTVEFFQAIQNREFGVYWAGSAYTVVAAGGALARDSAWRARTRVAENLVWESVQQCFFGLGKAMRELRIGSTPPVGDRSLSPEIPIRSSASQ